MVVCEFFFFFIYWICLLDLAYGLVFCDLQLFWDNNLYALYHCACGAAARKASTIPTAAPIQTTDPFTLKIVPPPSSCNYYRLDNPYLSEILFPLCFDYWSWSSSMVHMPHVWVEIHTISPMRNIPLYIYYFCEGTRASTMLYAHERFRYICTYSLLSFRSNIKPLKICRVHRVLYSSTRSHTQLRFCIRPSSVYTQYLYTYFMYSSSTQSK